MSLTSKFVTQVGDVTVTFDTLVYTTNDTFDIYSIGEIQYDFDVTSYGDVINNIGAMYGRSKMTVGLYTGSGKDLFDILFNELTVSGSPSTPVVPVEIQILTHTGLVYEFKFQIRSNGLRYKENDLRIELELDPNIDTSLTTSGVFYSLLPSGNDVRIDFGVTVSGIMAGQFIQEVVENLNPSLPTIHEPAETTSTFANLTYAIPVGGNPPAGINIYVIASAAFVFGGGSGLAVNDVAKLAVLDGDIYGTGFDLNFYVNRLRTNRTIAVDEDDIESLQYDFTPSPYNFISLTFDGNANLRDVTKLTSGNRFAEKSISGLYTVPPWFIKADYIPASGFAYSAYTGNTSPDIEEVIVSSGILAHQKALNAQESPLIRVETTVLGFDKIKPYNTVQFTGNLPDRYKYTTGLNPRYFRPTSLSYNLMEDKVKAKLYSIS